MTRPAIIVQAISQWVEEGRDLVRAVVDAEALAAAYDRKLIESREDALRRRIAAGAFLLKVRGQMPKRGTAENGWKAYLEAIELDDSTAHRWMDQADPLRLTVRSNDQPGTSAGAQPDAPPPTDADAPPEADDLTPVREVDRGAWCTPKKWADAVGPWDVDAFSNPRSHIVATHTCMLENGDDGFGDGTPGSYRVGDVLRKATKKTRFWGQPGYHFVLRALEHYGHTRFCFLLRLDTSTEWFERLWSISELIMIPRGERIEFEPPEGVASSSNPYPHGFYYRSADDVTDAVRSTCFEWRISR